MSRQARAETSGVSGEKLLLSIGEAARNLNISVGLTRKKIDSGELATVKIGRRRLVKRESVLRLAERGSSR
jgi:excisionase family DNA binding protein